MIFAQFVICQCNFIQQSFVALWAALKDFVKYLKYLYIAFQLFLIENEQKQWYNGICFRNDSFFGFFCME